MAVATVVKCDGPGCRKRAEWPKQGWLDVLVRQVAPQLDADDKPIENAPWQHADLSVHFHSKECLIAWAETLGGQIVET